MNSSLLCVVDTNVPKTANLATKFDLKSDVPCECILACIEAVNHVVKKKCLVIDSCDEIFDEYRRQLSLQGQPGVGDVFMKWVHDNRWSLPANQRVAITKNGDSYNEFPEHQNLKNFDISDRKFVAVSNAHESKPTILQATDSKWVGWKDALNECGIMVEFICSKHLHVKYKKKMR